MVQRESELWMYFNKANFSLLVKKFHNRLKKNISVPCLQIFYNLLTRKNPKKEPDKIFSLFLSVNRYLINWLDHVTIYNDSRNRLQSISNNPPDPFSPSLTYSGFPYRFCGKFSFLSLIREDFTTCARNTRHR